ncbi:phage holin [Lactococcus cremoris]
MKTIDKGTLTRTVLLWLAIINQILTALGINPLPLDDNTVSTVITTVFALGLGGRIILPMQLKKELNF